MNQSPFLNKPLDKASRNTQAISHKSELNKTAVNFQEGKVAPGQ